MFNEYLNAHADKDYSTDYLNFFLKQCAKRIA